MWPTIIGFGRFTSRAPDALAEVCVLPVATTQGVFSKYHLSLVMSIRMRLQYKVSCGEAGRTLKKHTIVMAMSKVLRMDNVGIVVESIDEAIAFFTELGLTLEGRATIEGEWAGRVTGLGNQHVEIAMMVTPDGHSRLELSQFISPLAEADHRNAAVNALGYLRVMFAVVDIDDTLARLQKIGAQLVGEVVKYEESYKLCYIRGPEGILIGLAEQLSKERNPL
jgi:catechol 2,3-dioxygenase-like lactoylglutathione lyase family enzyme